MRGKIFAMFAVFTIVLTGFAAIGARAGMPEQVANRRAKMMFVDICTPEYYIGSISGEKIGEGIIVVSEEKFNGKITFENQNTGQTDTWAINAEKATEELIDEHAHGGNWIGWATRTGDGTKASIGIFGSPGDSDYSVRTYGLWEDGSRFWVFLVPT